MRIDRTWNVRSSNAADRTPAIRHLSRLVVAPSPTLRGAIPVSAQHTATAAPYRRRNHEGVILDYCDPGERRAHHDERRPQVSDRRRNALIAAERELLTMTIIFDHLDLSGIALTRLDDGLRRIRIALNIRRSDYGMALDKLEEVAA
jgi:hypothetical protein